MRISILALLLLSCAAPARNAAVGPASPSSARAPSAAPEDHPPAGTDASGSASTIQRADLLLVLDAGIPRFLQNLETEPALEGGRFVGFRLVAFFPRDARFRSVDLRDGDVVTSVNGMPIERPEHAYRVWQELRVASELRVEVLRGGAHHEVRYVIIDG